MSEMDEIIREFLVESTEGLDQLDRDFVELEQRPNDKELLARIFRCVHTIKGTSGFLAFSILESVTHVGESLLADLRDGKRALTPDITSALLRLVDAIREILAHVEQDGTEGEEQYAELVALLVRLQEGTPAEAAVEIPAPVPAAVPAPPAEPAANVGEMLVADGWVAPDDVARAVAEQHGGDPRRIGEILVDQAGVPPAVVRDVLERQTTEVRTPSPSAGQVTETVLRVDVRHLDRLMTMVGELVLARNQILQFTAALDNPEFLATCQRLNHVTSELQESVMKTRMQPIGSVWSKFPRVVRDLAQACRKQVRIEMEGQETELDKTLIEAIKDPLTHIVRNSVDHGIELPAERVARGKAPEGVLHLRAFHEGGQVVIEIADDGGGIDPDRIRRKALDRGLVTEEQTRRMTERQLLGLIFLPGFSTAEKVTNVSGRGVGMDVVRTNIEKISGSVDLQSVVGRGTTLTIKIPLTLAIVPALLVTTRGDRYAIPQVSLLELVRLEGDRVRREIELIHGTPVYRLRGRLLPIIDLARELGREPPDWNAQGYTRPVANIVVLQAEDRQFGLLVEEINDSEEIVVKPLGRHLKSLAVYAGATIMGDGRVALILDVHGLASRAQVVGQSREHTPAAEAAAVTSHRGDFQVLLVFKLGDQHHMAIPLSLVSRLEEIPAAAVEWSGRRPVTQYRGAIMPLIRLREILDGDAGAWSTAAPLQVVVYTHEGRRVGLVVDDIVDIVEDAVVVHERSDRGGLVRGTAVLQHRVTDLLDIPAVIAAADLVLFDTPAGATHGAE